MTKINFKKLNFWVISIIFFICIIVLLSLILLIAQSNPIVFLTVIFAEPWKSLNNFSTLVSTFSILLLVGLAVGVTFKYRIYNFGVPGQMMFSASVTYILAVSIANSGGTSRAISIFLILVTLFIGTLSGFIISLLKTYFHVNEVISTILFNFIAWEGYNGLISSNSYLGKNIPSFASLRFSLIDGPANPSNLFSWGIIIAVVILIITILLFNNRTLGFKLNAVAKNPVASLQAKIDPRKQTLIVLPISGAIAGMAGYLYFLGSANNLPQLSSMPQEGFYGVSVACLAFNEPALMVISALVVSLFVRPIEFNGFIYMTNPQLAVIILGVVIYLMAILPFIWYLWDQSPYIQERWYKFKQRLFYVSKEQLPPELTDKTKKEVHFVTINLEEHHGIKGLWLRFVKWLRRRKE